MTVITTVVSTPGIATTISEPATGQTVLSQVSGPSTVIATAGQPGLAGALPDHFDLGGPNDTNGA